MKQFKGVPGPWVFDDLSMKIKGTGDIEGMTVIANVSPKDGLFKRNDNSITQCYFNCIRSGNATSTE